jgi:hypothetical protein
MNCKEDNGESGKKARGRDHYVVRCDTFWCAAYKSDDGKWREVGTDKELTVMKVVTRLEDGSG